MHEIVIDNKIQTNLDTIINEALSYLKSQTGVEIKSYIIKDNKIDLYLEGNKENISVLKDRLNINIQNINELCNSNACEKVKQLLYNLIKDNFNESFDIKLKSMDDSITKDAVFIYLNLKLISIPYNITIKYELHIDGTINMGYRVIGDVDKDELWYASSITPPQLICKLKDIKKYYKNKQKLMN